MTALRSFATAAIVLMSAAMATAQTTQAVAAPAANTPQKDAPATRSQIIDEIVNAGINGAVRHPILGPFQDTVDTANNGELAAYLVAIYSERLGYQALLQAMEAHIDKQIGAQPSASGSTSVASKGLVSDILGVAVENGAINRESKGTTMTFRSTPVGIVKALQGKGILDMYADYSKSSRARYGARLSVAASFDTARGSSAGTFTADDQQLSGWSVRYEIVNGRDPASPHYADLWKTLASNSSSYRAAASAIKAELDGWAAFATWRTNLVHDVDAKVDVPFAKDHDVAKAAATFRTLLEAVMSELEKLAKDAPKPVLTALDGYVKQLTTVQAGIDAVYTFASKGALVTADWSATRDPKLPDLETVTGIWEMGLGTSRNTDFTLNGDVSFYRSLPVGVQHQLKTIDLSAQIDRPLGKILMLPAVTFTIAARYSYLPYDTVASTPGETVAAPPGPSGGATASQGHIGLVQAKLTIPVKGSGVKIPLSVTASNRTELIKEKNVRASFGISFDLDTLMAAFGAKAP